MEPCDSSHGAGQFDAVHDGGQFGAVAEQSDAVGGSGYICIKGFYFVYFVRHALLSLTSQIICRSSSDSNFNSTYSPS